MTYHPVGLRRTIMRRSGINPRTLLSTSNGQGPTCTEVARPLGLTFPSIINYMKQRLQRRVRTLSLGFFFALVFSLCGCSRHSDHPVTVTILDPEWSQPELLPEVAGNNGDQKTSVPSRVRQTDATERFAKHIGTDLAPRVGAGAASAAQRRKGPQAKRRRPLVRPRGHDDHPAAASPGHLWVLPEGTEPPDSRCSRSALPSPLAATAAKARKRCRGPRMSVSGIAREL